MWFSAIYILLMISLVGCIIPRLFVYARALRARPPRAPRHLSRLPGEHVVHLRRGPRTSSSTGPRPGPASAGSGSTGWRAATRVAAERGHLREAGNLLFHLAVIVVLVGVAIGSLFGYKGGVIMFVGKDYGFSNNLTQYDDFAPGSLFDPARDGAVLLQTSPTSTSSG